MWSIIQDSLDIYYMLKYMSERRHKTILEITHKYNMLKKNYGTQILGQFLLININMITLKKLHIK